MNITSCRMKRCRLDIEARLAMVKAQGYEMMRSQQTEGVLNLSVPIFRPDGSVIAALTCPYLERLDTFASHLMQTSDRPVARRFIPHHAGRRRLGPDPKQ